MQKCPPYSNSTTYLLLYTTWLHYLIIIFSRPQKKAILHFEANDVGSLYNELQNNRYVCKVDAKSKNGAALKGKTQS